MLGVVASVAALTLTGCGSSGPGGATTSAPPSAGPAAAQPTDPATAKQAITTAWGKFFDKTTPIDQRGKYLQDGAQLAAAIQAFSSQPQTAGTTVKVDNVEFTSPTTATVTYDLLVNGTAALPGASGAAVLTDSGWKVSKATFCGLLELAPGATAIPGCTS